MSSLRIVCFGDSITGEYPRAPYRHQYLKYSDLLQLMLEARLGLGNAQVLNRGWAGQTSEEARKRLQRDLIDENPDIAFILLGANDLRSQHEKAAVSQHLDSIVRKLRSRTIKTLLGIYHNLAAEDGTHWATSSWRSLACIINDVAIANQIETVSFEEPLLQAQALHPDEQAVGIDNVHLNPIAEIVYARVIFSKLDELGWI